MTWTIDHDSMFIKGMKRSLSAGGVTVTVVSFGNVSANSGSVQTLTGHSNWVRCVCVLPNGQLISGSGVKTLRIWDAKSGDCVHTLTGHTSYVSCVSVLPW